MLRSCTILCVCAWAAAVADSSVADEAVEASWLAAAAAAEEELGDVTAVEPARSYSYEGEGEGLGTYSFVGKWRGMHGHAVGLCTAELVAREWVITAGHCAVRLFRKEADRVQITFDQGGALKRGVTHCVKAPEHEDLALCKLKLPVNKLTPVRLNSDIYRSAGPHGASVMCVGTYHGIHATGPKPLEYEVSL